jgi:hypothetical protein
MFQKLLNDKEYCLSSFENSQVGVAKPLDLLPTQEHESQTLHRQSDHSYSQRAQCNFLVESMCGLHDFILFEFHRPIPVEFKSAQDMLATALQRESDFSTLSE